jgi:hypothetical protein
MTPHFLLKDLMRINPLKSLVLLMQNGYNKIMQNKICEA